MRHLQLFFIVVFFILTSLPGLQMLFGFSREEKLHGVEKEAEDPLPSFDFASFLSERYQQRLEEWLGKHIGYRGHLVRTDNQIHFSVFNQISASYASPLVVGAENTLFERLYIDSINGRGLIGDRALEQAAKKLALLQQILAARGVTFILLITPGKTSIDFDRVPPRQLDPRRPPEEKSNYARLLPFLRESGVRVFDAVALLREWDRQSPSTPLFAKGGTHWTMQTSCRVSHALMNVLEAASGKSIPDFACEPIEMRKVPDPFDRDLADLCNLWNPEPFYETLPYPVPAKPAEPPAGPRMLFIGGSFLWSMFHYLDDLQIYSQRDMFYYFSRRFRYPTLEVTPIDRRNIDWEGDIVKNDYIVLEVNEANIRNIGSGFIDAAIGALRPR